MRTLSTLYASVSLIAVLAVSGCRGIDAQSAPESSPSLKLAATIVLPNVSGRIDHLAYDPAARHLFVAALGNDTVEVVDTATARHLRSLPGFAEPQGIAFVAEGRGVAIANGDSGTLQLIDASTFATRWTTKAGRDADNVRYDASRKQLYVAAQGGLAIVNPASGAIVQRIAIQGHPESFQLEQNGRRIFANLPGASQIVIADRQALTIQSRWAIGSCQSNYPMALDEDRHRLLIGCRQPASVALFEIDGGKSLGAIPAVGDTDDLFYDPARKRVYVIGGEGFVDVVQPNGDALRRTSRASTREGARTGLWVAQDSRLYVAVPARGRQSAEIRVFDAVD